MSGSGRAAVPEHPGGVLREPSSSRHEQPVFHMDPGHKRWGSRDDSVVIADMASGMADFINRS